MLKFLRKLNNDHGASMVQMIMVGAAIYVMGVAVFKLTTEQSKQSQSLVGKIQLKSFTQGIRDALSDPGVCIATFNQDGKLLQGKKLEKGIINKDGKSLYKTSIGGAETYNGRIEIKSFNVDSFVNEEGLAIKQFQLIVTTKPFYTGKSADASFATYEKKNYIPIWAVLKDNEVLNCFSGDDAGVIVSLFVNICTDFGGVFDLELGRCEGAIENFVKTVTNDLCEPVGSDSCVQPYKDILCEGKDVRGENHENWFINGFDADGKANCECRPRTCPAAYNFCYGKDLGTDHCSRECGTGMNTSGGCCDFKPHPSTVCSGIAFKQYDSCGLRPPKNSVGTQTSGSCSSGGSAPINVPEFKAADKKKDCGSYQPAGNSSDFCQGQVIIQRKEFCPGEQKVILGSNPSKCTKKKEPEKEPEKPACQPKAWSPSLSSFCSDIKVTQSNGCEERKVNGTKDCSPKGSWRKTMTLPGCLAQIPPSAPCPSGACTPGDERLCNCRAVPNNMGCTKKSYACDMYGCQ